MHAYTGCDTVSAFAGKGKAQALKLLTDSKEIRDTFKRLGQDWDICPDLIKSLEPVTCRIYAPKSIITVINDLRNQMFCAKKGDCESHQLPPCRDGLIKHAMRANYQAGIWKRCLQRDPQVPFSVGRGWTLEEEDGVQRLSADCMDGKSAPDLGPVVLQLHSEVFLYKMCLCRKWAKVHRHVQTS